MNKKTIAFDFDGVIHKYSKGWQDGSIYDEPVKGIKEVIDQLREEYRVVVYSTRCETNEGIFQITTWLKKYNITVDNVCSTKPPAIIYVDDRAINFNGNCEKLIKDIHNFKPWTEKARKTCVLCGKEFFSRNSRQIYCSKECQKKIDSYKERKKYLYGKSK